MDQLNRRDLLCNVPSAVLATKLFTGSRLGAQPGRESVRPDWYRSLLVGMELGPTGANDKDTIYMSKATGNQWVEALNRAAAEYGVVFMKDQNFAYYNSRTARKCPNLGQRDLLAECVSSGQKQGIPIIAYCEIQYDMAAWLGHPDWRMKDQDGNDIHGRLCYNSAYFDYNRQITEEMLEYKIDGFHFDMLDFGFGPPVGCWCEHCKNAFENEYEVPIPRGITWDESWDKMLQFRCDSNTRFCRRLQEFVHQQRAGVSVDFNYHGYPPFSWYPGEKPVEHAQNGDFVTAEGLPMVFGNYNPSLLSLFMMGARSQGPVQGVTTRSVSNYHDFTIRPKADLEWEVFTYLAHGAQCTIVDKANYDGSLDPLVYERIGSIFRSARAKRDYFGHKAIQEVGLYYSSRSRDWYGRTDSERYMAAFSGAHKALVQAHVAFGMVMDENATLERLLEFSVIYVPNAAILTTKEITNFSEYVKQGGNLLVTGLTGVYDRNGNLQDHCSLAGLAGVRLVRCQMEFPDNYVRLPSSLRNGPGRFLTRDIPLDWPILTWAAIGIYEPAGAQAFGDLMVAFRSKDNSWSLHMSPERVVGSAVFLHTYGKGKVAFVPCQPDAAFIQRYRMPEHRHFIRNLVEYLNPSPTVSIDAPASVEAVVNHDAKRNRLLVHLASFSAPPTAAIAPLDKGRLVLPPTMEEPMQYQGRITVHKPFSSASSVSDSTTVSVKAGEVTFSTREIHTVIVIHL